MIIQSLRLKNIKSYGTGPEGNGISISFEPGVNCVAGRNGHGKTTLIEALGYALFSAEPVHEETFRVPTYFLRAGEKEGEIDVVFEHAGESYRVERGLGQSKRRSKVVQVSDESTCAMDDAEVSAYLCRLLGFKEHRQLSDLFANLVGVKQGRLTWPFDSKPKAAKEFFEPLLDVAIFHECTSRLTETQGRFKESMQERENQLSAPLARIQLLSDSQERVPVKTAEVEARTRAVKKARELKEEAEAKRKAWEEKLKAFNAAKSALEEAKNQLALAGQKLGADQQRLQEAEGAARTVKRTEPGYQAYVGAETQIRDLQKQQTERSRLEKQQAEAATSKIEWEMKQAGAQRQAGSYSAQREERAPQAAGLRKQMEEGAKRLEETKLDFEQSQQASEAAKRSRDALEEWIADLPGQVEANERLLAEMLHQWTKAQSWDAKILAKAREEEQRLDQAARDLSQTLAKAEEAKRTLGEQLEQISGGVCPFLQEKCRQFDPKAVQSDLSKHETRLAEIRKQHREALERHKLSKKASEILAAQEAEAGSLRHSLQEKVRLVVERHNKLFPPTVQRHFTVVQSFLSTLPELALLPAASYSHYWTGAEFKLDSLRLDELVESEKEFRKSISNQLALCRPQLRERFDSFDQERTDRVRKEQDLKNKAKNLAQVEREVQDFSARIELLTVEIGKAKAQTNAAALRVSELDENLKVFANLEDDLRRQHEIKDNYLVDYKAYLGAKPQSDKLQERQDSLKNSRGQEDRARKQLEQRSENFDALNRDFNQELLNQAWNQAAEASAKLAQDERALEIAKKELREESDRLKQWQEACRERDRMQDEIGRLKAAGELARLAGKVLKGAAPAVAQHLCSRIGANAQRIFNQINQEPIELEWKAEPQYSLRIVPGERRFAMLSGGEQTKLAVAMTLAMIQQFSALRFAVFDEPTYAVDAESRSKLADAILEAQKAAGLDQLIIVSHDDAFEGKAGHVIVVRKLAGSGTEAVAID